MVTLAELQKSPTAINSQDNLPQPPLVLVDPSDRGSPRGETPFSSNSRLHEDGPVIVQLGVFFFFFVEQQLH